MYRNRESEKNNNEYFHAIMSKVLSNDEDVKLNHEYSNNPDVFVGSCLGYISYDKWIKTNKAALWKIECNNKAIDDINKDKYFNKTWY